MNSVLKSASTDRELLQVDTYQEELHLALVQRPSALSDLRDISRAPEASPKVQVAFR